MDTDPVDFVMELWSCLHVLDRCTLNNVYLSSIKDLAPLMDPDESPFGRAFACAFVGTDNPKRHELFVQCLEELCVGKLQDGTIVPVGTFDRFMKNCLDMLS